MVLMLSTSATHSEQTLSCSHSRPSLLTYLSLMVHCLGPISSKSLFITKGEEAIGVALFRLSTAQISCIALFLVILWLGLVVLFIHGGDLKFPKQIICLKLGGGGRPLLQVYIYALNHSIRSTRIWQKACIAGRPLRLRNADLKSLSAGKAFG